MFHLEDRVNLTRDLFLEGFWKTVIGVNWTRAVLTGNSGLEFIIAHIKRFSPIVDNQ